MEEDMKMKGPGEITWSAGFLKRFFSLRERPVTSILSSSKGFAICL